MQLSTLRIIGGKWRSRKISFIPIKGLRPTTDVTRETLFNWLAPIIANANCLDLFAGSGALSFEALSRGAKHVVTSDASIKAVSILKQTANLLNTTDIDIYYAKIPKQLISKIPQKHYDIIFLDPPFHYDLAKPTCEQLLKNNYIAEDTIIYLKIEKELDIQKIIPASWQILRQKITGQTKGYLLKAYSP
jgi:16S rRNA (guanine966-N2)-methyltransferase